MIEPGLDKHLAPILSECYRNIGVFAKVFFPEVFDRPFSKEHEKLFSALDDRSKQRVVITAPRGFGKTSITALAYLTRSILFQEHRFIVVVEASEANAIMQTENVKKQLLRNPMIGKLFGNMRSETFSKEFWVADNGVAVMPRGAGQQIRGLNYEGNRPGIILLDDVEDPKKVANERLREDLLRWFFTDVMLATDQASTDWRVIVIGTVLHATSLISTLMDDPDWHSVRLELFDDRLESKWPEFMPTERVKQMVESYERRRMLNELYREYRGLLIAEGKSHFRAEYFRRYDEAELQLWKKRSVENVVLIDPARTLGTSAADTAIVGVGVDTEASRIYVRDIVSGHFYPDQLYDEAFKMCSRLGANVLGVEVTSLDTFITYPLQNEIVRRGLNVQVVELRPRGSKEERIAALLPLYRQGLVWHNKNVCHGLEAQLLSYPHPERWDIMDAFAYIVELLDEGGRFFSPAYEEDGAYPDESEYEGLEYEPALKGYEVI